MANISDSLLRRIVSFQREELTESKIYSLLARRVKGRNRKVLLGIAEQERLHHDFWMKKTGVVVKPFFLSIFFYWFLSLIFGLTFTVKLMERGEVDAQKKYSFLKKHFSDIDFIIKQESEHEQKLISLINEERLGYIGSMVLGLNDALVELTGALAGLTFALGKTRLIAIAGLVTGIAASLSMMSSEYLSKKEEKHHNPFKASVYTGVAYILAVLLLVIPYFLFSKTFVALLVTVVVALLIILFFTFFTSVVNDEPFFRKYSEMALISLGVAVISFVVGLLLHNWLGV